MHDHHTHYAQVLVYALSPLDFLPELAPLMAILADLIILPIILWLVVKLIPAEVRMALSSLFAPELLQHQLSRGSSVAQVPR